MKYFCWLPYVFGILLLLTGCSESEPETGDGKIVVFCSVAPIGNLAERVGGERVTVHTLIPPGKSAHEYSPSPSEIKALQHADLFFRIHLPLENIILKKALDQSPVCIYDASANVRRLPLAETGGEPFPEEETVNALTEELFDQHIWLSLDNCRIIAGNIQDGLCDFDPENAGEYQENYQKLVRELDAIKRELSIQLAPLAGKTVFVYHPAYGYFTDEFGLKQKSIEYDGKPPTARQLGALRRELGTAHSGILFSQVQNSADAVENAAKLLNCRVIDLDPLAPDLLKNFQTIADVLKRELQGEKHDGNQSN